VLSARDIPQLKQALEKARQQTKTTVIVIETDPLKGVPAYDSWWDVPVAEVSALPSVRTARKQFEKAVKRERCFL
jgi:3D-(3,5/4)-trihydroxycyclohexane-1,2-dione acylhydrolase (decyclizing)